MLNAPLRVTSILSPLRGSIAFSSKPTACAVGYDYFAPTGLLRQGLKLTRMGTEARPTNASKVVSSIKEMSKHWSAYYEPVWNGEDYFSSSGLRIRFLPYLTN